MKMKKMSSSELRQAFLDFFKSKDHLILPSSSLIPSEDPTLLWINAGMTPLKPYFEGRKTPPHPRVTTAQKCIRTNDIENVGLTARHHTFFEMLGNFSFADYFKEEAIKWAWEFITHHLEIPAESLWITVFKEDEEAADIWRSKIGIKSERVVYMGKKDNFWEIGEGPSGPCSEIHYDRGIEHACGENCTIGCDCDRFNEIWNLVFTQFNKLADGSYQTLKDKHIDTGFGLERVCSVLQGKDTNFETDLFWPYLEYIANKTNLDYSQIQGRVKMAFHVIADHVRTMAFTIADGALPSNEGRGYVIRRILRRASRFGRILGLEKPFLYQMIPLVSKVMGAHYPELLEREAYIQQIVRIEEERFLETLTQGLELLNTQIEALKAKGEKVLSGLEAFKLYDTYGFPLDLTQDALAEQGLTVDHLGFEAEMTQQRERARKSRAAHDLGWGEEYQKDMDQYLSSLGKSEFVGYDHLKIEAKVKAILAKAGPKEQLQQGESGVIVLDQTPFYPEGGGQRGDNGVLQNKELRGIVKTTYPQGDLIYHQVEVTKGKITKGETLQGIVDEEKRVATARNHTATHLLHQALRNQLGKHVQQAGSLVEAERMRFDFTHFQSLTATEIENLEAEVNQQVLLDLTVKSYYTSLEKAKAQGVIAFFAEKYADEVRVVKMGDYCAELCGGTHLERTGQLGPFKIVSESAVAAGIRRIEVITGFYALAYFNKQEQMLQEAARLLKTNPTDILIKIEALLEEKNQLNRRLKKAQSHSLLDQANHLSQDLEIVKTIPVIKGVVEVDNSEELRQLGDMIKDKVKSAVIALGAKHNDKGLLLVMVTKDLLEQKIHAGKIVGKMAKIIGGGGGGRGDMAQAGGPQAEKLTVALAKISDFINP